MVAEGHTVASLTGGIEGSQRDAIIDQFRAGQAKVLITTNVLARGIDVSTVSMVINYVSGQSLPLSMENSLLTAIGYPRASPASWPRTTGRFPNIPSPYRPYRAFWPCRCLHLLCFQPGGMEHAQPNPEVLQHRYPED
jgi:hypothetical protein